MTGIYIHIPFCKKVCYYCDFHFTVSFKQKDELIDAIIREIEIRKDYIGASEVSSVYFGGGTPSVLSCSELQRIMAKICDTFTLTENPEITLEANPDDISAEYLKSLRDIGINRLSIGVQSFFDDDLKWMNRRHTAEGAERAIKLSQDLGFRNMNIDLLYGLPKLTASNWDKNLDKFLSMGIPHLSAYHLTIEPKTVFGYYKRKGRLTEVDEELSLAHYHILINKMKLYRYNHYEISNFCKDEMYSRHNTNYWKTGYYLGIGPSAHSFNGKSRQWNVSVNSDYIKAIGNGTPFFEIEYLSETERFNDYLLTGLRTTWGIDKQYIRQNFDYRYLEHFEKEASLLLPTNYLAQNDQQVKLTEDGLFISDKIISELFYV